ncbi:MAG: hypothetical protein V4648_10025 [Bacteroidota bacterium]
MKKFAFLLFVLLPLLQSCSSDDAGVAEPEPQLTTNGTVLKRTISTSGPNVNTSDYYYNGNKLEKMVSSTGNRIEYTYTGSLITKTQYFDSANISTDITNFQYNPSGKMTQRVTVNPTNNTGYRCELIYNSDGTVSVLGYQGDGNAQNTQIINKKAFLFPNGDVEKIEEYVVVNGNNHTRTRYYTYDDKNSPTNAILGYNKIKFWDTGTYGNSHNNTAILFTTTENSTTSTSNLTYTYNSFDYLVTASYAGISIEYFYLAN